MHDVKALIAKSDYLQSHVRSLKEAALCQLPQGLALLPVTHALAVELDSHPGNARPTILEELSAGTAVLATDISRATPVAFVTTFYFGGQGGQDAMVWFGGELIFSPSSTPYSGVWPNSPISRALRILGVTPEDGKDEFDTIGLGNFRTTEKWAESSRTKAT